ncbi:SHOCT domain-containing protein [Halorubrum salsamenti]|uniref:SHOCT domain-containing protein n=1 Tax=Halorubrum salsamenti TaxID=2583990 RepID=UPI001F4F7D24|nr:SHOCT domain-containing protein [Halorubrum salsamenti]
MTTIGHDGRIAAAVGLTALGGVALAVLLAGVPTAGTAGATTGAGSMGMMGGMGGAAGPGIAPFLFMLLFLVALLALAYVGVRALSADGAAETEDRDARQDAVDEGPIERVKRKYTEGELSETEFERALERELADEEADDGAAAVDGESRDRADPAYDR